MPKSRRVSPPARPSVLVVNLQFATEWGGLETQTWDLLRGLRDLGWDVRYLGKRVCPLADRLGAEDFVTRRIRQLPVPYSPSHPPLQRILETGLFLVRGPIFLIELYAGFLRLRRPGEPVLVLSILEKLLLTPLARALGHRVVWGEHVGAGVNRALSHNPFLRFLAGQTSARKNPAIPVSPSHENALMLHRLGFRGNRVVENGIDVAAFQAAKARRLERPKGVERSGASEASASGARGPSTSLRSAQDDGVLVGYWGRLVPDKGLDFLLKGFSHVAKEFPEARVVLVGEGPEKERLEGLAARLGIRDRLEIRGRLPAERVPDFVASLDVAVLPSSKPESFGLTAAEGMAAGLPVIVTSCCGIAEKLTGSHDAIIVKPRQQWHIADALRELLARPDLRESIGAAAAETAEREFGAERMIARWAEVLRST